MTLIKEKDRAVLRDEFAKLHIPVKLMMFTQQHECDYCRDTRTLAEEIATLSEHITLEVHDFVEDAKLAETYGVDKIPALNITRGGDAPKDYGIRYFGIPSGYEFSSLIEDIVMVGTGETGLMPETKEIVAKITSPLHFQVFVTPTCPYCPPAVRLAHQLAMENDLITADMVEAIEFPHLSMKYQVQGVPRTVVNENVHIEGAVPEAMLMARIGDLLDA
jgi:glutaredoxin-like protein